jgi:hypothetical protein
MESSVSVDPISGDIKSKFSRSKRWQDLYRKIHILFLNDNFIHKKDYERTINQLNARITALESGMITTMAAMTAATNAAVLGHTHLVPQSPAGANPSSPAIPTAIAATPTPAPGAPVVLIHTEQIAHNLELVAQGPAAAPIPDISTVEGSIAATAAISDVGV